MVAVIVFCPRCDRAYTGSTKKEAEAKASTHVDGQHLDYENPFRSEED